MRVTTGLTTAGTVGTVLTTADSVIPIIIRIVVIVLILTTVTGKDRTTDPHVSKGITTGHGPPSEKGVWDGTTWQTARASEQRRDFPDY